MLKWMRPMTLAGILLVTLSGRELQAQTPVQTTRTVRAGDTQTLLVSPDPIAVTNTAGSLRGKTATAELNTNPKTIALMYTAPATTTVFTEVVTYTNPNAGSVAVTVTPGDTQIYNEAFKALFVIFVVALLLESGLAVVFNWRPFVVYFDGRGVKTVISLVFAFIFVRSFDLDVVTRLVNIYSQQNPPFDSGFAGRVITAFVVAGGSAAVNSLLITLGFRSVRTSEQIAPRPPRTEGWVSVALIREKAVGPVDVFIGDPAAGPPVAGTITGGARRSAFMRLFLRDRNRFPPSGGFTVPVGVDCEIRLEGVDAKGTRIANKWGPHRIAPGAFIDLELDL